MEYSIPPEMVGAARDARDLLVLDAIFKRGAAPGMNVFWCKSCIPSFCRRLLSDWERSDTAAIKDAVSTSEDDPC